MPKLSKNTIVLIILGVILVGIIIFFGIKVFNQEEYVPTADEETKELEDIEFADNYDYPIKELNANEILFEYEYYIKSANELGYDNINSFKSYLKELNEDYEYQKYDNYDIAQYNFSTIDESDSIDYIAIYTYSETKNINVTMGITIYDEVKANNIINLSTNYDIEYNKTEYDEGKYFYTIILKQKS